MLLRKGGATSSDILRPMPKCMPIIANAPSGR